MSTEAHALASNSQMGEQGTSSQSESGMLAVIGIASAVALVHLLTNQRYGFHRDEL
jgi:hypothetical protein